MIEARHRSGFTLLEVLIAFAILMVALGLLLPAFSTMLDHSAKAAEEARAAALASNLLDRVGADLPLSDGTSAGEAEGYGWHLAITPLGAEEDRLNWPSGAHRVEVTIEWRSAGRVWSESFATIRLGPKPPAVP